MGGSAVARRIHQEGGRVILVDHPSQKEKLVAFAKELDPESQVLTFCLDVSDATAVETEFIDGFLRKQHPQICVWGLFNNAGVQGEIQPLCETSVEEFDKVISINVGGAYRVLRAVSRYMKEKNWPGSVVNTSSTAHTGPANMVAYGASKAAVVGLTGAAAKDLAPYDIRVNAVAPGHLGGCMWDRKLELQAQLDTQYWPHGDPLAIGESMIKQVPMRRYGEAEEVAATVAFLLSKDSSFMTGENLRIAGGQ